MPHHSSSAAARPFPQLGQAPRPGLAAAPGRVPAAGRNRADPRRGDLHDRLGSAQHLRAGPQPRLHDPGRRPGLPARHQTPRHRRVRNGLLRLPGLPRRHHEGPAGGHQPGHAGAPGHRHPADAADQGRNLGAGPQRQGRLQGLLAWLERAQLGSFHLQSLQLGQGRLCVPAVPTAGGSSGSVQESRACLRPLDFRSPPGRP